MLERKRKLKQRISTLLLVLLLVWTMSGAALAAGTGSEAQPQPSITAVYCAGETTVTVTLEEASGVTNGKLQVAYDAGLVTLESTKVLFDCGAASVNKETAGALSLAWVGSSLEGGSPLLELTFRSIPGAAGDAVYTAETLELYTGPDTWDSAAASVTVPYNPFEDIDGHWAEENILKAYHAGLFQGVTETTFVPEGTLNRAMFVTVLYRVAGSPQVELTHDFTDVKPGSYYEAAVSWAVAQGVTKGVGNGAFAPGKEITRQELATMLYRFAKVQGRDVSGAADLSGFQDGSKIVGWATAPMAWAVDAGILRGYPGKLLCPAADSTRAQAATVLCRYLGL